MTPFATTIAGLLLATLGNAEVVCRKQLRLKPVRCVCGRFIDAAGGPVAGVTVKVSHDGTNVVSMTSASDGKFAFTDLRPGTYAFTAQATGFRTFQSAIVLKPRTQKRRRGLVILLDTDGLESCGSYVVKQ